MNGIDKLKLARSFDASASHYDQFAVLQRTVTERLIDRLDLLNITPGTIIDIGAGTGTAARTLAGKYKRSKIVQLDLSRQMLIESRRHLFQSFWAKIFSKHRFICGDAESLPVADCSVGLAFSSLALQWCNDLDKCLAEARRVLLPNGLFLFATLGPDTLKQLRESWASVDNDVHINTFLDMHDIGDALVRAGMESVVMDVENMTMTYTDCKDLMGELKALGAHNVNVSRHKGLTGKAKLEKVIQAYEKHRSDGKLPASYEIIYGHAWRPAHADAKASHSKDGVAYVPATSIKTRR